MNETEFSERADDCLRRLADAVEASGVDADCSFKGDGVLEIELERGGKIIVNRHTAAREIWVAAKSGGFHFRAEGAAWNDTRDGTELFAALSRLLSQQSGAVVALRRAP
jgi:CyaY protein